jgi:hypothetical protein
MIKYTFSLFLLGFTAFTYAQQPVVEWAKTYGGSDVEYPADILLTADNKYIIAGSTNSKDFDVTQNRGGEDVWVVKLDEDGTLLWQKTYGGTGNEGATSIKQTKDGGYMLLGVTNSKDGDFIASKGGLDIFLSKLDAQGNILWTKIYGGSDYDFGSSFFETTTGEFVMSIVSKSSDLDFPLNYGDYDMWVMKLSAKGDIIWTKHFGGSRYDFSGDIIQADKNSYLLVGFTGSIDSDMVEHKGFLDNKQDIWIKLDTMGQVLWHKTYGFEEYASFTQIRSVKSDSTGYISVGACFTGGNYGTGHYGGEMYIAKLDKNGNLLWRKMLGGLAGDSASDVEILSDGSFVILGDSESKMSGDVTTNYGYYDYWVVRLDSKGEKILWQISLGGFLFDRCESTGLIVSKDNKLIVVGETSSFDNTFSKISGKYDWGVVKLKNIGLSTPSVEIKERKTIKIYPNPASHYFNIENNEMEILDYELLNMNGKIVQKGQLLNGNQTIYFSNIPNGFYLLNVTKNKSLLVSKKLIISDH